MGHLGEIVHHLYTGPVRSDLFFRGSVERGEPWPGQVTLTWLGAAGLAIEQAGRVLLVDPFVTRPGLRETLARPLRPDADAVRRYLPRADVVVCTHSHHDHLLDVPEVARQTGAPVVGSESTCNLCRASGVDPERLRVAQPPDRVEVPPFAMSLRPSLHGKAVLGRVPLRGSIPEGARPPLRLWGYRTEGALGLLVEAGEPPDALRIFHLGSADFLPETVEGLRCDVLAACVVGRSRRPDYTRDLLAALRPRVVVPIHYDDFLAPIDRRTRQLPGADLEGFCREVRVWGDGCEVVVLDKLETLRLVA